MMYASSPAELERLFQGHIDRLLPHLPHYFDRLPAAPFLLRPLDASLSGLTYGYYEPPAASGWRLPLQRRQPAACRCCRQPA